MKVLKYLKGEPFLVIGGLLSILTAVAVPPDKEYFNYCNFKVLGLLFCLMAIVEGIRNTGFFEYLTGISGRFIKNERQLVFSLCAICFLSSALITNDVALITFVPFSLSVLKGRKSSTVIYAIVLETIAANLGSMITPIGNPQNMYLYTQFSMLPTDFFRITVPLGCISAVMIGLATMFCSKKEIIIESKEAAVDKLSLLFYGALFLLCLFAVFGIVSYALMFVIVAVAVFIKNRKLFLTIDYNLLLTFILFFIFVGNAARMSVVQRFIAPLVTEREITVSIILSQIISNVPAAAMMSAFTENVRLLIIGTNVGGLGTLIASMASLISYRKICAEKNVKTSEYVSVFSIVNLLFLIILYIICIVIFK